MAKTQYEVSKSIDGLVSMLQKGRHAGKKVVQLFFDGSVPEVLMPVLFSMGFKYERAQASFSALVDATGQQAELFAELVTKGGYAKYLPAAAAAPAKTTRRGTVKAAPAAKLPEGLTKSQQTFMANLKIAKEAGLI